MKIEKIDKLIFVIIFLGLISLILENGAYQGPVVSSLSHALDLVVTFLFVLIFIAQFVRADDKLLFLKKNFFELLFIVSFIAVVIYAKLHYFFVSPYGGHNISTKIILAISVFNVLKVLMRIRKLSAFLTGLTTHPAQTIMLSFAAVIMVGTILLMMPFTTVDHSRIGFVNAFFTAASATCVTGLIVVNTATAFSAYGKAVILLLIQTGGLGIMILAFFAVYLVRKKLTIEDKMTMSYLLNEDDMGNIVRGVRKIVLFTLSFEICGAVLLFFPLRGAVDGNVRTAIYSLFHSISAFCNAGFALFPDNLCRFRSSVSVNLIIAGLIISGGISFAVLSNSFSHFRSRLIQKFSRQGRRIDKLTLNTKVVLAVTLILLVAGTLLIYKLEHKANFLSLNMKTQYMIAFFQSVSLRTAGFNTVDISSFHTATYAVMILFMFIGGASGSTAGGIKVNTVGVIWSYVRSIFSGEDDVVILKHSISRGLINQAFFIMLLGLTVVFVGSLLLSLFEKVRYIRILFEVVSAFGTVGLSTGITGQLSWMSKLVIIAIMFIGRLGPLTIVTAFARKKRYRALHYPEASVNIG